MKCFKCGHVRGGVGLGGKDRVQHRKKQNDRARIEAVHHRRRDARVADRIAYMKPVAHHPRQGRSDDGADPNHKALEGEASAVLFLWEHIYHKGPEGLHGDVDGRIQDPQQARSHPQSRTLGHEKQRHRSEQGPHQEIGAAAAERRPGAVRPISNNGLNQQTGHRGREPEHGNFIGFRSEGFVNGTHVGHLEGPAKLDPQKAKTHVPNLPEIQSGLRRGGHRFKDQKPVRRLFQVYSRAGL